MLMTQLTYLFKKKLKWVKYELDRLKILVNLIVWLLDESI